MSDALTRFGQFAGRIERLEVRCNRCDRRGSYNFARLVAQHGPGKAFAHFAEELAASCPRHDAAYGERCSVYFPQLPRLLQAAGYERAV